MTSRRLSKKSLHRTGLICVLSLGAASALLPLSKAGAQGEDARSSYEAPETLAIALPQEAIGLPSDLGHPSTSQRKVVVPRWQQGIDGTPRRAAFEFRTSDATQKKTPEAPEFHFLPDEETTSRAIGRVNHGRLVAPATLSPEGEHHKILPRQRARNLNYGHHALIELITSAAAHVATQYPESLLGVGNIGRRYGGPIPYSVSHQVGHDVDLAFYATDPEGNPTLLPDLLVFNDDGTSRKYNGYYQFDVARNWALVEALIQSDAASIQYLFISKGLRALLLEYAEEHDADEAVIAQAEILLRQPAKYIPHDDHLHVRIYCTPEDLQAGCEDIGAKHTWMPDVDTHVKQGVLNAAVYLEDSNPEVRLAAVMRLGMLKDFGWMKDVAQRLDDDAADVRQAAAVSLLSMAPDHAAKHIGQRLLVEEDPATLVRFFDVLSERGGDDAAHAIATWMEEDADDVKQSMLYPEIKGAPLKLFAIDALARTGSLAGLTQLSDALTHADLEVRSRAARAITMVTNHQPSTFNWASPRRSYDHCVEAAEAWTEWIEDSLDRYEDRLDMVLAGMDAAGYPTSRRPARLAKSLAQAAGDQRPYVRENAQRMLMRMTGKYPPSLTWSPHDARAYWTRWVRRNEWAVSSLR